MPITGPPIPTLRGCRPQPHRAEGGGGRGHILTQRSSPTPLLISRSCIGRETRVIHGALRFPFETPRNHIRQWGH